MKHVKNYLLSQVAANNLTKNDALILIKELFENETNSVKTDDIAIVGMSCRFPHAYGTSEFWSNLENGVSSIEEFPQSRKDDVDKPIRDYFKEKRNAPQIKYRRGAYLEHINQFDADYFNISAAEARCMDPLQRLFLEVTWEALEDAGYSEKELYGSRTGVYVGDTDADYLKLIQNMEPYVLPGNTISIVASRIGYILNLASSSHMIDTACSASLAAVHHAIKGLITGDCEMAVAGGINLTLFPIDEGLADIGIASPDYQARTFDAAANGTVWGEGVGVIVLKTLEKAKKDRNYIYAVIKGSSMNSDGKSNGITAPSALAQTELIKAAWRNAGIDPRTVTYIEAHGTGTKLGDPIEIEGISNAFRSFTDEKQFCALGALKTNIGHLDTAAGIAGLIKTVLALKNKKIPATLNFREQNPHINFIESPVYVNTELRPWETEEGSPRRAGVSAFGLAGTNCHVVLEEYESQLPGLQEREQYIFTLSAKSKDSFDKLIERYCCYLSNTPHHLSDICYTSNVGRGHYSYRLAILTSSIKELQVKLERFKSANENIRGSLQGGEIFYANLPKKVDKTITIGFDTDLNMVIQEYMQGKEINWEALYDISLRQRIPIPVYPFSGRRYWVNYVPDNDNVITQVSRQQADIDSWFYHLNWVEMPLDSNAKKVLSRGKTWLVFADEDGVANSLCELMKEDEQTCIIVEAAELFEKISSHHYRIRPSSQEDYKRLIDSLADNIRTDLSGIVHLWTCCEIRSNLRNIDDLIKSQENGVLSLFCLLKALKGSNLKQSLEIKTVSNYVNFVTPEDTYIFPEKAMLWGLMKVAVQEFSSYLCSCLDIETIECDVKDVAKSIYEELKNDMTTKSHISAWRKGKRYIQQLSRMKLDKLPKKDIKVREGGVYFIAGGAGAAGLETCRYLAQQAKVKIVLVNRTPIPDREQWDGILMYGDNSKVSERIRGILSIEQMGSEVTYYAADITDLNRMKEVMNDIKERYGQINGVINATMLLKESYIEQMDLADFIESVGSKVTGTYVLNSITKDQALDFFILFSSIASFLGGARLGSYAAANAFMDQYAQYQSRRGTEILVVNWSYLEMGATTEQLAFESNLALPISPENYKKVLDRLFSVKLTQAIIANINNKELAQVLTLLKIDFLPDLAQEIMNIENQYIEPETCRQIIESYNELKQFIISNESINDILQRNVDLGAKFTSFEELLLKTLNSNSEDARNKVKKKSQIQVSLQGREDGIYTETEIGMAQVWGEVLGHEEINLYEDFFENGDSLMLMSVINNIKEKFNMDLPIEVFFQEPTINGLSRWVDESKESSREDIDFIPVLPHHFVKD